MVSQRYQAHCRDIWGEHLKHRSCPRLDRSTIHLTKNLLHPEVCSVHCICILSNNTLNADGQWNLPNCMLDFWYNFPWNASYLRVHPIQVDHLGPIQKRQVELGRFVQLDHLLLVPWTACHSSGRASCSWKHQRCRFQGLEPPSNSGHSIDCADHDGSEDSTFDQSVRKPRNARTTALYLYRRHHTFPDASLLLPVHHIPNVHFGRRKSRRRNRLSGYEPKSSKVYSGFQKLVGWYLDASLQKMVWSQQEMQSSIRGNHLVNLHVQ